MTRWETPSVSCGNSCVFWFALGPGPFFCCVFAVASRGETQIWLGDLRVVCRFAFFVFVLVFLLELPTQFINGTTAFHAEFIIRLTCLYLFSGPSLRATSAEPEEKKTMVRWQLKQDCNPCVKDAVFATFCASCTRGTSLSRILLGR